MTTQVAKKPKRLKDLAESTKDMFLLDPKEVEIQAGFNPRDFSTPKRMARVEALATSIAEVGVLVPIVVRYEGGRAILVDGETRLRASWLAIERGAPLKTIPAIGEPAGTSEEDRLGGVFVRNGGEGEEGASGTAPLTMLEQANGVARLRNAFGWSVEKISRLTGFTDRHIANLIALNGAPEGVKSFVRDDKVAGSTAIKALRASDPVKVLNEAVQVAAESGKARATPKHLRSAQQERPGKKRLSAKGAERLVKALVKALAEIARFTTDANSREAAMAALREAGVVGEDDHLVEDAAQGEEGEE